jgi:hypothetical protein
MVTDTSLEIVEPGVLDLEFATAFTHLALDRLVLFHVVAGRRQALSQPGNWLACFTQPAS